jgi:integrase/recombinase XerD
MFDLLFTFELARLRHQSAPLRREREQFLDSLKTKGSSHATLLQSATRLVHIIEFLKLNELRPIGFAELKAAGLVWVDRDDPKRRKTSSRTLVYGFTGLAKRFLKFHHSYLDAPRVQQPHQLKLNSYVRALRGEKGLSEDTIRGYEWHVVRVLNWISAKSYAFSMLSNLEIDRYLMSKKGSWTVWTMRTCAGALRGFFRFAVERKWCSKVVPEIIQGPLALKRDNVSIAPSWNDVRRLLLSERLDTRASLRAQMFLVLFALYGLRTSEATGLLLNDINWKDKTFTFRRAKNYSLQSFPIIRQFERVLLKYLQNGRPKCESPYLIVTLRPPHRRLNTGSVSGIVTSRFTRLGIKSVRRGPCSLRHACATRLLSKEMSLQQIADFLGHNDCLSVGIYAKHDVGTLRKVVAADLCRNL